MPMAYCLFHLPALLVRSTVRYAYVRSTVRVCTEYGTVRYVRYVRYAQYVQYVQYVQ